MISIVHVQWWDASSHSEWHDITDLRKSVDSELELVDTVGMLVHEGEKKILLIQTAGTNQVLGMFEIPRGCIKSIRVICELPITIEV